MHWTPRRERFRALLAGDRCLHPGSVYDAISARIAEDLGFEIGMFAGSIGSMSVIGAPDLITLTLSEFAQQAYRINRAGNLPLLVDADHGYGNALNVKRTVEELESAGVAGLTIEDTDLPQPFGTVGKTRLIPIAEGIGKMKAALAGRQDPTLAVIGRTSAVQVTGIEDAIARARAYEAAGVDAMFFTGIKEKAELEAIHTAVRLPIILGGVAAGALRDRDYLSSVGVRICLQGHQPFAAAVQATYATLKALREGADPDALPGVAPADLMKRVTREDDHRRWMQDWLAG
ncbi:carboxyvinyl-carboxyphosphonate phosphorylmutase [Stella humosa]|uniref:Carboxyvinyl-carboxyphosphonate phosphorylmutase n=1 Tax=Stella humosa TaxID=94 RepID=A0A3N1M9V7_9PROT|nr:isocitrate lyase/PEP mutase family protein [Stella humosa]ROP99834.1 carboxyvinyl-carboxyphosphonate phosphorylmutase [Stella humosa]BBK30938.1 oxaloacetate decarboxylase [Stella humosa]